MSKIAVVLIHGIGEQRPMATLRDFVSDVFGPPRSKPDKLSESFEVRRLDVNKPNNDPEIYCYEFYWAHHMRDARFGHLATWLIRLFRTPFKDLKEMSAHLGGDKYLKAFFIGVAFILLALVVTGVVTWAVVDGTRSAVGIGGVLVAILLILGRLIWQGAQSFVLRIVTDAARYLDNTPENIGERQKIRAECVQFLGQLNRSKDPKYDRIVVIGHSLGSVIAYDALKFLWAMQETHASLPRTVVEQGDPIATDGALLRLYGRDAAEPEEGPMRQAVLEPTGAISSSIRSELFKKLLPSTEGKISHLVTVGSPLTHAPILLAQSLEDFWELQRQRELPTSPPRMDQVLCGWGKDQSFFLHHAALFAVVEWSNFYLEGDPIGGPLGPLFGNGVRDDELASDRRCWSNHTRYWKARGKEGSDKFKSSIRDIVGLDSVM